MAKATINRRAVVTPMTLTSATMMWLFTWLCAAVVFAIPEPVALDAPAPSNPADAVVLVHQGNALCAGAIIDELGTVVTSYHCVVAGGRPLVVTRSGQKGRGRIRQSHVGLDLAVIDVPDLAGAPFLVLADKIPEVGDRVRAIGHPFGARLPGGFLLGTLRWSVTEGSVSAVGEVALQMTAAVNPGNSGGPVVNESGELVGVVSRRLTGEALGFATRADQLQGLLASDKGHSAVGGTVLLGAFGGTWNGTNGSLSFGPYFELALKDRIVVRAQVGFTPSPRFNAVRYGSISWSEAEASLGVRQRLLHGPFTSRIDAYGGVIRLVTMTGNRDDLSTLTSAEHGLLLGGSLNVGFVALDGAAVWLGGNDWGFRGMLMLRVPGTFLHF